MPRFTFTNRIALISLLILATFFVFLFVQRDRTGMQEISYTSFQTYLEQGRIESVKIVDEYEIQGAFSPGDWSPSSRPRSLRRDAPDARCAPRT
jgi:cell division protease FtsH